jgi:CheY-like chemotaxis protein
MGGAITVSKSARDGSVFVLEVPVEVVEPGASSTPDSVAEDFAQRPQLAILVADDHAVNRRIVALLLEPLCCAMTFAENGEEAVRLAAVQRFDAVLMDMQMPVLDGLDATRVIREGDGPNKATPILALTANAMDHHRAAWRAVGVDTFLTKPIAPSLLLGALTSLPQEAATDAERAAA